MEKDIKSYYNKNTCMYLILCQSENNIMGKVVFRWEKDVLEIYICMYVYNCFLGLE